MDTKYLDEELEKLNLWDKKGELSEFGKEKLNEFRAIKQALNLHSVSVSSFSDKERNRVIDEIEFLNAQNLNGRETEKQLYKQGIADAFDYLTNKSNAR